MATALRQSGTSSGPRRKLALIIGIGNYEHIPNLDNPENDANDLSSELRSIGFDVKTRLHLKFYDMEDAITAFKRSIEPGDLVLFYFAGHGTQWEVRTE